MIIEQANRELQQKVNRRLKRRILSFLSQMVRRADFRRVMQAEEAMEVAGLEAFSLDEPAHHMDLTRLRTPIERLSLAILNDEVLARRFEPTVESEFVALLDLSRSMRYPLGRLYGGLETREQTGAQIESGKPSLLKLIAGTFLAEALQSGFTVRLVTFGPEGIDEGPRLRRGADVVEDLFRLVDKRMSNSPPQRQPDVRQYEEVLLRVSRWKGAFLFAGDFLGPVYQRDDDVCRRRWLRLLRLYQQWAFQRPVVTVRINHQEEVRSPLLQLEGGIRPNILWRDQCHMRTEGRKDEPARFEDTQENQGECIERLTRQRRWEATMAPALRACCRGYLNVTNLTRPAALEQDMLRAWARLVER